MTQVIHGLENARFNGVVLTIGNYDGVHVGHRAILAAGRRRADALGTELVVMTFDPHPATILTPDRVPEVLTPLPERVRRLHDAGAQTVIVVRSRREFFATPPEAFIDDIVMSRFRPAAMVEGSSFHYGAHRRGTPHTLVEEGRRRGFDVEIVSPIRADLGGNPGTVISSSLIRHLVRSGTMDQVTRCLGSPYALLGRVEHGAGRGRRLGFPTANLHIESQLVPAEGVYVGRAWLLSADPGAFLQHDAGRPEASEPIIAAVSIGRTPTFEDHGLLIEAHLLDFESNLYEQHMRLELIDWIRPQECFTSVDDLRRQIEKDVQHVRKAT